ncbi:MAG TPA: DUF4382 domain-containing protein [Steroidobacteraceae bacterium]|nr:DUF4382 domain-containing protein [Steroidobacteraceae bacterium]
MHPESSRISRVVLACSAAFVLAACGGGDDREPTGTLKLGITDAPVDAADAVVVQFSGVELKPKGGEPFSIDFVDSTGQSLSKQVDLYLLSGTKRELLLEGEEIPAGEYEWMRLKVDADPTVVDSYIEIGGGQCELRVPSGDETGLKINRGFTVGVGAITDLTIDFDLRKSIVEPPGQQSEPEVCDGQEYLLKPVLRVVDNLEIGTITGKVDPLPDGCDSSAVYPGNVYLFGPYTDVEPAVDDYDGVDDAVTWAMVDPTTFEYTIGFVPAGKYVIAYTCSPDSTQVDADTDVSEEVTFVPDAGVQVELAPGETKLVDFPPAP